MSEAISILSHPNPKRDREAQHWSTQRAFTLVELMVAVTGGLFVSMVVFALARDGSRFYQRESRIAEATLGSVIGFDRLRSDIARAGYLSTPNIQSDPTRCSADMTPYVAFSTLQQLASIQITATTDPKVTTNSVLQNAPVPIVAEEILLAGAYSSVERFDTVSVDQTETGYQVRLQQIRGALFRLGYPNRTEPEQKVLLAGLFPINHALRLYNVDTGTFQIGVISGTGITNGSPTIFLASAPPLGQSQRCSLRAHYAVNVVNFVRYALRKVQDNADYLAYQQLFSAVVPFEDTRLELTREELDATGAAVANTREVVAEYAVDLRFAITQVTNPLSNAPTLSTFDFGSGNVLTVAGPIGAANGLARPQSIRSVRPRLSIRSREADRDADVNTTVANLAPGLYRIGIGKSGGAPFARVRTQQADTFLSSQSEVTW